MFVGHYSMAFVARRAEPRLPLWLLFLAAQLVDIVWAILVLLGVERLRIVPGITASNNLDLGYMPFTHSLPALVGWAVLAGLAYRLARPGDGARVPFILGLAVASHWLLDLLVHRPDLPLLGDHYKVGLGLWNHPVWAAALELGLIGWTMTRWADGQPPERRGAVRAFGAVLIGAQLLSMFAPAPSPAGLAVTMLVVLLAMAAAARLVESR